MSTRRRLTDPQRQLQIFAGRVPCPRLRGHECDRDTNFRVGIALRDTPGRGEMVGRVRFRDCRGTEIPLLWPAPSGSSYTSTGVAQFVIVSGDVQEIAPEACSSCCAIRAWHPTSTRWHLEHRHQDQAASLGYACWLTQPTAAWLL